MDTIIITPKSEEEYHLLKGLLKKMHVKADFLSNDAKEEMCLLNMMKEADRNDVVSEEEIMNTLCLVLI